MVDVAEEYHVSTKTIYGWLKGGVSGDSSALEVARLKRELEAVYGVLGKVTAELKRPKKVLLQEVDVGLRSKVAVRLGIDRNALYRLAYTSKRDEELKSRIEAVLTEHPRYGHRRVALELGIGRHRARRVMRLYGLGPRQRTKASFRTPAAGTRPAPRNLILELGLVASYPSHIWACDFTYLRCMEAYSELRCQDRQRSPHLR